MTETKIAEKTEPTTTAEAKPRLFNVTQIAGGALAAVTSAAVGSRLGYAGTLVGAGIASVLAAFASTLYTKGLERTRDGVKKIVLRDPDGTTEVITASDEGEPEDSPQPATGPDKRNSGWRRPLAVVGGMVATAAVTFVVAMGVVTGWEFGTGQTLDGRSGTTIGQAGNRRASATATPTASATASATQTATATATPTESATPTATATPSATATPTATPTATASTTAEAAQASAASGSANLQG